MNKWESKSQLVNTSIFVMIFVLFISINNIYAQKPSLAPLLSGFVVDSISGEKLIGCNIFSDKNMLLAQSNNYGYFSCHVESDATFLIVSYIGYKDKLIILDSIDFNGIVAIEMVPGYELQTVEITSKQNKEVSFGKLSIPLSRLVEIPIIAGEPDVFKALALLPGVSNGQEGTSGLLIRGGSPDQNLVLLDGATVYNTSHLFGLVTIFNPLALKSIDLTKGNFPARYGGRLSSVIDITMKEGSDKMSGGEYSVGLLNSSFLFEGPIKEDESSFLVAGRTTYSALVSTLLSSSISDESKLRFFVYDLNAKFNFNLNKRNKVFFSGFSGQDRFGNTFKDREGTASFETINGNTTATFRHIYNSKSGYFWSNILAYNNFNAGVRLSYRSEDNLTKVNHSNVNKVRDWTYRSQLDFVPYRNHYFRTGIEWVNKSMIPSRIERQYEEDGVTLLSVLSSPSIVSNQLSVFIEDKWQIRSYLSANLGFRVTGYLLDDYQVVIPEPRISAEFSLNSISSINIGYARMSQALHYLLSTIEIQNEIWLPATRIHRPQISDIISMSYSYDFRPKQLDFQVEIFYKKLYNQVEFRNDVPPLFNLSVNNNWEQSITGGGTGTIYGLELLVRHNSKKWDAWVAYTLSTNFRQFQHINFGNPYRHIFDRPHQFSFVASYRPSKALTISSNAVIQSGNIFTVPTGVYRNFFGVIVPIYESINNYRTPPIARIDLGVTWSYETRKGNWASWNFSLYNFFANFNINTVSYNIITDFDDDSKKGRLKGRSFFRLIPGFNYKCSFGTLNKEKFFIY